MFEISTRAAFLALNTFLLSSYTGMLHATECGVLRLLENKSNGVQVLSNSCGSGSEIALGGKLNLTPGARLWIKAPLNPSPDKHFQAICQNRSQKAVGITVSAISSPWISAEGLKNCSAWIDNKMSCDGPRGEPQVLYCVIAEIAAADRQTVAAERTTSVTMREIKASTSNTNAAVFDKQQVIDAIQPEAGLCRSLYQAQQPLRIDWIVDSAGKVFSIIPTLQGGRGINDADKRYIDCVVAAVKDFPYPKPSRTTMLSADF